MKTIGLVGGTTWHSSLEYYKLINGMVHERLGGSDAAKMILYSLNFGDIARLTTADKWDEIGQIVLDAAKKLEAAGADCILLGANTMHRFAHVLRQELRIPLIHIAEEVAAAIREKGLQTVTLLGTRFTMQLNFYREILSGHGISTLIPDEDGVNFLNTAIYEEMGKGLFLPATRDRLLDMIAALERKGAQGAILGCTEIPLLISQEDCSIPVFDTTFIHARAAVDFALGR